MDIRLSARMDPRTFLLANPNTHGIIIDEFQLVPNLLSYIQTMVDTEKVPGFFILTGSQNFLMNKAISQDFERCRGSLSFVIARNYSNIFRRLKIFIPQ